VTSSSFPPSAAVLLDDRAWCDGDTGAIASFVGFSVDEEAEPLLLLVPIVVDFFDRDRTVLDLLEEADSLLADPDEEELLTVELPTLVDANFDFSRFSAVVSSVVKSLVTPCSFCSAKRHRSACFRGECIWHRLNTSFNEVHAESSRKRNNRLFRTA
jgi:hypothetical protein